MIFFNAGINLERTQEQILEAAVSSRHVLHLPAALYRKIQTRCKRRYNTRILHIVYHRLPLCCGDLEFETNVFFF